MRLLPAVLLASVLSWTASGQTYTISTFAGGVMAVNVPGTSASLGYGTPQYIAADSLGNVFFVDQSIVLRLDATTGVLTLVAGTGTQGFSGDNGPATSAQLSDPEGLAVDSAGNLYISDGGRCIRKVSNGMITTVAGTGTQGFSGDNGPATSAQLWYPEGIAVDSAGNLYIADYWNNRIRKVSNGVITTVAGNGTLGFSGDNGPATSAQLWNPTGVAVDSAGNLYIADTGNYRIRKVSNGVIVTVAGNGVCCSFGGDNGPATSAQLGLSPAAGVAVDSAGNLYIADTYDERIRKVSNGVIATVAGGGSVLGDSGPARSALLSGPNGVAVDSAGNLYIADTGNSRIRKVSNQVITTVAGSGAGSLGDNGPATSALLYGPFGVAVDSAGNLYIADTYDNCIRKVSGGVITTVAGNGTPGFSGDDGPATSAELRSPWGVAVDSAGDLYIADSGNFRIRKVSNGVIATVAGGGSFLGDTGPATSARLWGPEGIAVDSAGNLYIADPNNNRIRMVSNGVITAVAGDGGFGFFGDNGPATYAALSGPQGVAVDSAGNLYIADTGNNCIRKVSNGVITTVVGNGAYGFSGDNGPAASAQMSQPTSVALDSVGNLYIGDFGNSRIRKVSGGVITTAAGNGTEGFSGDNGPATSAQLYGPFGVAVDSGANAYVADFNNNRIRVLTPAGPPCTYSVPATTLQVPASGGSLAVNIQTTTSCSWTVSGLPGWITVSGASSGAGSGTVTLAIAPNSGTAQSATISIAGVAVTITQPAAASACTYAISPTGQAFAAAGGTGTINITAGAGCPWTAASTVSWVTISGVGTGLGNGSVTFQAAPNTGADRSGSVAVAGLSFTVEEGAASSLGLISAGSMAQLASGGYWTTTITLVNTGSSQAQARLSFFDDNGNPLALQLSFPSSSGGAIPQVLLLASTLDRTLNPGAELVIQTTGANSAPTLVGWAQLLTNGAIGGFAVFSQAIGSANQEAEVPLENRNAGGYVVPFDDTNGGATGIALANVSAQAANTAITIRDATGAVILTDTLTLPAMGHTSFDLVSRYASSTAQRRGTLEFSTPVAGQISVLGLKFNGTGAFSTIPAIAQ